ncbi:MAG TPA: hypothetical protein VM367_08160 [Pseudonocardia sp.]|nr:hypothetical protein [Pseudonocardia sp.]
MAAAADAAGHELLVRLAGRLPDELLWRLRDWLAAGAGPVVAGMLPRALLRGRVGLTREELDLLGEAVDGWGGPRRLLDALLPGGPDEREHRFGAGLEPLDAAALSVLGIVRGHPGCRRLARAVRLDGDRDQTVVLVRGGDRPWLLTGTLQRVLRAHGERTPCVEVLLGEPATTYHRAALAAATPLWQRDRAARGTPVGV